jgi:hypothetical protein
VPLKGVPISPVGIAVDVDRRRGTELEEVIGFTEW